MDRSTMQVVFDTIDKMRKAMIEEGISTCLRDRLHDLDILAFDLAQKEDAYQEEMARYELVRTCTRCNQPIQESDMFVGDGDGKGQRFAHHDCFYRNLNF